MSERSTRADRVKACELAALMLQGEGMREDVGRRALSLTMMFESYINRGCAGTIEQFGLGFKKVRGAKLRVVTGGSL